MSQTQVMGQQMVKNELGQSRGQNSVGNFGLFYGLFLFFIFYFCLFDKKKKKKKKNFKK
jgi:preprotein translocase subunit YajC